MFHPSFFILFRIIPILRNNKLSEYFSILQNKQIWHVLAPAIQPVLLISLERSPNIYLKVLFNFEHVIRFVQSQQLEAWMNETSVSIVNNKDTTTRSSNAVPMSLLLTLNIFRCTYCWQKHQNNLSTYFTQISTVSVVNNWRNVNWVVLSSVFDSLQPQANISW